MSEHKREVVLGQYTEFIQGQMHKIRTFERASDNLDVWYEDVIGHDLALADLWNVIRQLLVLSHGQATVERGFSVNRQIAVENLKDLSYVSQRVICDAVRCHGGILNIPITRGLRAAVTGARQRYAEHLDSLKAEQEEKAENDRKRANKTVLDEMKAKRRKLEIAVESLMEAADSYAEKAEAAGDVTLIIKSNSLRNTAKNKKEELARTDAEIWCIERLCCKHTEFRQGKQ